MTAIVDQPPPVPNDGPAVVDLVRTRRDQQPPGSNAYRVLDQLLTEIEETTAL